MKKVGIVFGGASSEHDVSFMSAYSVIKNISRENYQPVLIIISREGRWYWYTGDEENLKTQAWENDVKEISLSLNPDKKGFYVLSSDINEFLDIDVMLPILHGKNGEDGTIQGMFEMCRMPYAGSKVCASAMCMDKEYTHIVLSHHKIKMAKWLLAKESECFSTTESEVRGKLSYPVFIKPANAGSSVGVSKAACEEELESALELAFKHDKKALIEEMVVGKEVEISVLGYTNIVASLPGEIAPTHEFYDYEAKYIDNSTTTYIPARIEDAVSEKIQQIALQAYKAMECTGMARVDFFIKESGEIVLNEINTIPGFTNISMFAKLMEAVGISYASTIDILLQGA